MNADKTVLDHLTEQIIGSALSVSNALGAGFLEKVSENALAHESRKACPKRKPAPSGGWGLGPVSTVMQQRGVTVMYDGVIVGNDAVDLLVQDAVIVELKAIKAVAQVHRAQCINYL